LLSKFLATKFFFFQLVATIHGRKEAMIGSKRKDRSKHQYRVERHAGKRRTSGALPPGCSRSYFIRENIVRYVYIAVLCELVLHANGDFGEHHICHADCGGQPHFRTEFTM
jgi:hypothetical protein